MNADNKEINTSELHKQAPDTQTGNATGARRRPDKDYHNQLNRHTETTVPSIKLQQALTDYGDAVERRWLLINREETSFFRPRFLWPTSGWLRRFTGSSRSADLARRLARLRLIFWSHDQLQTWHWTTSVHILPSIRHRISTYHKNIK